MAVKRINIGHDGNPARETRLSQVTANGRWQVIVGNGDDLLGLSVTSGAFVRDLDTGVVEAVAFNLSGELLDYVEHAIISADGRYVVFTTASNNVVAGDIDGLSDVFRYDRVTKVTELVSTGSGAAIADSIAADGRYIAFKIVTSDVIGGESVRDQFVHDMVTGQTQRLTFTIDASSAGGPLDDRQNAWGAMGVTLSGGAYFQFHQYFNGEDEYRSDTGITTAFGGGVSVHKNYTTFYSADGSQWVSHSSARSNVTLRAFRPGDDPEKIPEILVPGEVFGSYTWCMLAENGQFAVLASRVDPATGQSAPGIYVWDTVDRSQTKVGSFRLVAPLDVYSQIQDISISADGSTITWALKDLTPVFDPITGAVLPPSQWMTEVFQADNPFGNVATSGIVEIAKPVQWSITGGGDVEVGTSVGDELHLLGGADRAWGAAGDDEVFGDAGNDILHGNIGDDTLAGGDDNDELYGGDGEDWLHGGRGLDELHGGTGKDHLFGEDDSDILFGGDGDDELEGGGGNDVVHGGAGDDELTGGEGNDILTGDSGDETFRLEKGDDIVLGGTDPDGRDIDILKLGGRPSDFLMNDEQVETPDGKTHLSTSITSSVTGYDHFVQVEHALFDGLRTNVATVQNVYLTLAKAANVAYEKTASLGDGWKALSALELGIARGGTIDDPASPTAWTYTNGHYSAIGPARGSGLPVEAVAQVYFAVVDGKTTLLMSIRGTDSPFDTEDYPQFQWHYDRFKPLVDAVLDYVDNDGYAHTGRIDQVWISGHSLGGAAVQQMMQDPRIAGDPRFVAATYGSPGSENHAYDPRLVSFEHSADGVPLAGDIARNVGLSQSYISSLIDESWGPTIDDFLSSAPNPTFFRTAGDVVRLTTPQQVGANALAQHGMDNYVASLSELVKHPEKFPVVTRGTAGIPGSPGHIEVALGTDGADRMKGAWAWVVQSLRGESYTDGGERFVGGKGADRISGGSGRDSFEGSLTELNGDVITDLAAGEAIRVWGGSPIQSAQVGYSYDAAADRGTLNIAGAEIYLEGRHAGVFTVAQGVGYSEIVYTGKVGLTGTDENEELAGGDDDDTLRGKGGDDHLYGGDGNDTIAGDGGGAALRLRTASMDGNDWIDGGSGENTLTGGGGSDTFVLNRDATDTITDFTGGWDGDVLDVTRLFKGVDLSGDPFPTGHLSFAPDGSGGTVLVFDADGRDGAGIGRIVAVLKGVSPGELTPESFSGGGMEIDPGNALPTIRGTDGRDHLVGTGEADRIIGYGGYDVIEGGEGNDLIYVDRTTYYDGSPVGGEGTGTIPIEYQSLPMDVAYGGKGHDRLINYSSHEAAEMHGGDGDDFFTGGHGYHFFYGDAGADRFLVQHGHYTIYGGEGADTYIPRAASAATVMDFDVVEDRIDLTGTGITRFDQIVFSGGEAHGRFGHISVNGLNLHDVRAETLSAANFVFDRGWDRNIVTASSGAVVSPRSDLALDEVFRVDGGAVASVSGGAGNDRFYFGGAFAAGVLVDGGLGWDAIVLQGAYTGARTLRFAAAQLTNVDTVELLTGGDQRYGRQGGPAAYDIVLGPEAGSGGKLILNGAMLASSERLSVELKDAGIFHVAVYGGDADDILRGSIRGDTLSGGRGKDVIEGRDGDDTLTGDDGDDTLSGGADQDALSGGLGRDILYGGDGDDRLSGGGYINAVAMENVRDELYGGAGRDTLVASSGASLTGGADADVFAFDADVRGSVVEDFRPGAGGDVLDLRQLVTDIGDRLGRAGPIDAVRESLVRLVQRGADVVVQMKTADWVDVATVKAVQLTAIHAENLLGVALTGMTLNTPGAGGAFVGGEWSDTMTGTAAGDLFRLDGGGYDHASGGAGDDGFVLGGALDPLDVIDGGDRGQDQLGIRGSYGTTAPHLLGAGNLIGIETMVLMSGSDTRFGGSGAERFTYNLRSVDANVAPGKLLTVNMNTLMADEGVVFDGSGEKDGGFLFFGGFGSDRLTGGAQADGFYFGAGGRFGANDVVIGGGGDDQLGLQGNYTVVFAADQIQSIETIVAMGSGDTRFGKASVAYSYDLTLHDANRFGDELIVNGNTLGAAETLRLDGAAESDAVLKLYGGAGRDILIGGAKDDVIVGGGGADVLTGGGGADRFVYASAAQSSAAAYDRITDFDFAVDRLDLAGTGYRRDADTTLATGTATTIGGDLTSLLTHVLSARGVSIVKVSGGDLAGHVFVAVDQNGVAGFQADGDLLIDLGALASLPATGVDFII